MLTPLPDLLDHARRAGYAIGYFESWDSYSLEAVVESAEMERSPAIIGFGCMMTSYEWMVQSGIASLGGMARQLATESSVPMTLLLNEAKDMRQIRVGMDAGFAAVMLDTSSLSAAEAIEATRDLCGLARERGVAVEGELGRLPDATAGGINDTRATLTDPEQAALFAGSTGVDCLAVSIGNVHLLEHGMATIDMRRLRDIHERVDVPLVIHGGTGFPEELVSEAIQSGVAKFNVGTILKRRFLDAVLRACGGDSCEDIQAAIGSHRSGDVLEAGKDAVSVEVSRLMRVYGSNGKA